MSGFLHRSGRKIIDGDGNEILLIGWGLGNLFVKEGYMWGAFNTPRFDRSRRIEQVVEELTGKKYARDFWRIFRERYIAEADFRAMRDLGCNSVRVPMDCQQFMEEGEGIAWREKGFEDLRQLIDQCEKYGLYVFLDMHCAPGGQTGANIDNSIDDRPRLFLDPDNLEKSVALWRRLAQMCAEREIVGGYDLLNEPIAPGEGDRNYDAYISVLAQHYRDLAKAIREVDPNHLLSIEGAHWATDLRIFTERFDENMVLHFHRYAQGPDIESLRKYMEKAAELDVPLWLGETGENVNEWYAAMYPLALELGIGINVWPWKKLNCTNSPYSVRKPADYDLIMEYIHGGKHPGYAKARRILDEYLENIRIENCVYNEAVMRHVLRRPPFELYAVDFDEFPGRGVSFSGSAISGTEDYRKNTGMCICRDREPGSPRFAFDSEWDRFTLVLHAGEFAAYSFDTPAKPLTCRITVSAESSGRLTLSAGGQDVQTVLEPGCSQYTAAVMPKNTVSGLRIFAAEGTVSVKKISIEQ